MNSKFHYQENIKMKSYVFALSLTLFAGCASNGASRAETADVQMKNQWVTANPSTVSMNNSTYMTRPEGLRPNLR
jgi:uncharacterized lipoprotein YajG